ncbi:T9SS type A sorting domain-containing protein [Luteirhabdus pelagi]|uniref:T9SS type A sorting domain-containing protein n=1 Tax=Luteirhabdus pelagi TaxID=2792783 RepID=UPI00193A7B3C|nr:T9SS type A sorting domain-containing protein [Luteirhabdus pelagi]
MMKKITFLVTMLLSGIMMGQVVINELDADQTSTDTGEFIELKSDNPNQSLDGFVVVLYNGSDDQSYAAYDLDGFTTDANGFLLLANDGFPGQDISLGADNGLQNGADAVAIYQADATDFPEDTPVTDVNLIDAIVYGTGDADDPELLAGLNQTIQYDEDANGNKDTESIQRDDTDGFCVGLPTPDAENIDCNAVCPLSVAVESVTCDAETTGTDTYTTVLSFTGGNTETYTITATEGTIGGDDPSSVASGVITITGVDEGTDFDYEITSALCNITNTIVAPTCEPATEVGSIAALRAGTIGESYTLTSEAILTFQRMERNQKWIEDATAAILIDDAAGTITTSYAIGDGISGISGQLGEFGGVLQFVPDADPGAATSTGNAVNPQVLDIDTYVNNFEDYESELIAFANVAYPIADGTVTYEEDMNYDVTGATGTVIHRTNFDSNDCDYIGAVIPQGNLEGIIALAGEFNGTPQVYVRNSTDIDVSLAVGNNSLDTFAIFPNPTNGNTINIVSQNTGEKQVVIFDVLGKRVMEATINEQMNVSALNSGVYIVKISQGNATVTKKLVVK